MLTLALSSLAFAAPGVDPFDHTPLGLHAIAAHIDNVEVEDIGFPYSLAPARGEEGHWAAVRFAPALTFSLRSIDATFTQEANPGFNCTTDVSHDVIVFMSSSSTPPANPTILFQGTFDPVVGPDGAVPMSIELPTPITVPRGMNVYAAFEMAGAWPDVACLMMSEDLPADPVEDEFWSFAVDAPFAWMGLDDLSITGKAVVTLNGYYTF